MILSRRSGDSGWRSWSPHRQLCSSITGSQASPVLAAVPAVVRLTSGLDRVREMGFGRDLEAVAVAPSWDECRVLPDEEAFSSILWHRFCTHRVR